MRRQAAHAAAADCIKHTSLQHDPLDSLEQNHPCWLRYRLASMGNFATRLLLMMLLR